MTSILPFSTPQTPTLDQVGGKALALITMTEASMPVPPGFVLTVDFFEPWQAALQETPEWEALIGGAEEWGRAAKAVERVCRSFRFRGQQQADFIRALDAFQDAHAAELFAVRSSSPEEDLAGASFAGGYKTTLGVTPEGLESAILDSFISAFDERVFLYKKEHGFALDQPRIAVIVQQQIAAAVAGVAFSLNPLNNCYDEAVINANFGLGESVVAGEAEPDVFVVNKVEREIIETQVGGKAVAITLAPDGGIVRQQRHRSEQPCLTPPQVLALTDLLTQTEAFSAQPVDVEWAISDEKLYLLQARPITTYLPLPEEMITPPGERKRLYADSTLIEQGVQKPLSVLGTEFLRYVLNTMTGPMGGEISGVDGGAFTAGGRYYMNLSYTIGMMGVGGGLAPGSIGDQSVMDILDSIDLDQYLSEKPSLREAASKVKGPLKMIPLMLPALKALRNPDWILQKYHAALPAHMQRVKEAIDPGLSMHEQAKNLTALLHFFFYEYGLPMVFAPQIALNRMKKLFEGEGERVDELFLSLGTSLPGNKTAEMGAMMFELAASDAIDEHDTAASFLDTLEQRTLDPKFLQAWDDFVAEFGARCPREIDVATPRPNEQPALLFEQLKGMASAQGDAAIFEDARRKREEAYAALHELALRKGKRQARSLERFYKTWLTLGGYRETPKHYVIKIVDMFRKRAFQVGEQLVEGGRLDEPGQIFDLTIEDIDNAFADASLDLRALAAERTVLIDKIKRSHHVARIIDSRGKIFYPPRKQVGAGELAGVAISPGIVRGRVKVLRTATEKKLLPGEILVTRATDPGWTPLFINAGGVILEIGGALQHGAVVAREYGLPCVSGLDRATEMLEDGQLVEIDGANGIVRVLDGKIPASPPISEAEIQKLQESERRREEARAKRQRSQTLLRILPIALLPVMLPVFVVAIFVIVKLLVGQSIAQSMVRVAEIADAWGPTLIASTQILALPIILAIIWRNRGRIMNALRRVFK